MNQDDPRGDDKDDDVSGDAAEKVDRVLQAWAAELRQDLTRRPPRTPWCPPPEELAWMAEWGVDEPHADHVLACVHCSRWLLSTWVRDPVPAAVLGRAADPLDPTATLIGTVDADRFLLPAPIRVLIGADVGIDVGLLPPEVRVVVPPQSEHLRAELEQALLAQQADGGERDAVIGLARAVWRQANGVPFAAFDVLLAASHAQGFPLLRGVELAQAENKASEKARTVLNALPPELLARSERARDLLRFWVAELERLQPALGMTWRGVVASLPTGLDEPDIRLLVDERRQLEEQPIHLGAVDRSRHAVAPVSKHRSLVAFLDGDVAVSRILRPGGVGAGSDDKAVLFLLDPVATALRDALSGVSSRLESEQALWRLRSMTPLADELLAAANQEEPLLDLVLVHDGRPLSTRPLRLDLVGGAFDVGTDASLPEGVIAIVTRHRAGADPAQLYARADRLEAVGQWSAAAAGYNALAARSRASHDGLLRRWLAIALVRESVCLSRGAGQGEGDTEVGRSRARSLATDALVVDPARVRALLEDGPATPAEGVVTAISRLRPNLAAQVARRVVDDPEGRLLVDARELGGLLAAIDALIMGSPSPD